tara:strand:+ start:2235 stop:3185 length:951 start_codon:yes stop_codon:yes gene_type:complete
MKHLKPFNQFLNEMKADQVDLEKFPNPLPPTAKKDFLKKGLKDGDKLDDIVKTYNASISVKDLKPSQSAIYLGKSLGLAINGVEGGDLGAVISQDNHILDGHHRYAATTLNNPKAKVNGVQASLDIADLIPVLRAAGDAMDNQRGLEPKGGDVNIFKATMKDVKACVYEGKNMNPKFYDKEKSIEWFENLGEKVVAERLKMLQSKLPPNEAPPRKDMPKIEPEQVDLVKKLLNKGAIDAKPPYANESNRSVNEMKNLKTFEGFVNESKANKEIHAQIDKHMTNMEVDKARELADKLPHFEKIKAQQRIRFTIAQEQ